jgi:hypothetical protein
MSPVERHGQCGAKEKVENNGVDIRVPLDQSEHRWPLPSDGCGFFFPSGEP